MNRSAARTAALAALLLSSSALAETYTPNAEFFAPKAFSFETTHGVTNAPTPWSPGVYQRYAGDGALGYFLYADNTMAVHPSNTGPASVILKFTAPRAGSYRFSGTVSVIDQQNGSGIGVTWTGSPRQEVLRGQPPATIAVTMEMAAGQQFVLEVDPDGTSAYDTTGMALVVEGPDAPVTWRTGSWSDWSTSCGQAARTRIVDCTNLETGEKIGDESCAAVQKPQSSEASQQTTGCTYSWQPGDWTATVPSCGPTVQTRSVECRRSDGVAAGDESCTGTRPDDTRPVSDFSACTYGWQAGEWIAPPTSCGTATRTRQVVCVRSDGTTAPEGSCPSTDRPTTSEKISDFSGCSYGWVRTGVGNWTTCVDGSQMRPVEADCRRSDGTTVSEAQCDVSTRPVDDVRTCSVPIVTPPPPGTDTGTGSGGSVPGGTADGQIIFRRSIPKGH